MKKYRVVIKFSGMFYNPFIICVHYKRFNCRYYNCIPSGRIQMGESLDILRMGLNDFDYIIDMHNENPDISTQKLVDIILDIKINTSYKLSKPASYKLLNLTSEQIATLILHGYRPADQFLQPYIKKRMKTIINAKILLGQYKKFNITRRHSKKIKQCLIRVIKPYTTMKFNLYMLKKKKGLCPDAANIVESFIIG